MAGTWSNQESSFLINYLQLAIKDGFMGFTATGVTLLPDPGFMAIN